ncbi:hypothetical protein SNOG_15913 [Parastagonospora nodorum SN15]|uniref:Uncharacterized protein n=1 Tax=Phaeosphaeria nodorum (strain SN15 / ATCC MYA-4574 / FGSC 10173) TaxID=321614 RepID=Q0TXA4_PHANO|nr:hypothetical protein SNOG_15913 [Parastagonospora nodorum SN15]EAT76751.1 hypothetical protein SNOG_15913 [Parastagonospora nodorum SN15]
MSRESGGSFWNLTLEIGRMQGYLRPGTLLQHPSNKRGVFTNATIPNRIQPTL